MTSRTPDSLSAPEMAFAFCYVAAHFGLGLVSEGEASDTLETSRATRIVSRGPSLRAPCYFLLSVRAAALPCAICGYPIVNPKNHDIPAPRAAKMFPVVVCKCGKPARVRCFNGIGTIWVECEDGHGRAREA